MSSRQPIFMIALAVVLATSACEREPTEPEAPVKTEEEIRQEQEAARRSEQTEALAQRANELVAAAGDLRAKADARRFGLPESLEATLSEASDEAADPERLLADLRAAAGDEWEAARSRLEGSLAELEQATASAEQALAEWEGREQEALAAREDSASPIDPATGLIRGLDSGDYEQYLVSAVVKVQERLRRLGLYAGPADGIFGRATLEAVGRFQEQHELQVSGVPSPMTRARLFG